MRLNLCLIALFFALWAVPARAAQPEQLRFHIYGLYTPEQAYIWAYYLRASWISYPDQGLRIYSAPRPIAYVPMNADGNHAPNPQIAGYSADGRTVLAY